MLSTILLIGTAGAIGSIAYGMFRNRSEDEIKEDLSYDIESIVQYAKRSVELTLTKKITHLIGKDLVRQQKIRNDLRRAVKHCMHGSRPDKMYVKNFLKSKLSAAYQFTDEIADKVIPFDRPDMLSQKDKFDIVLYDSTSIHGEKAFGQLVEKYKWNVPKMTKEFEWSEVSEDYCITREDIDIMYAQEIEDGLILTLDDKINIIVQRVFESYKGLGVVDDILDQEIDGVNGGSGGIPPQLEYALDPAILPENPNYTPRAHDQIHVFYRGNPLRMEFLSFGDYLELNRICQNIYTYESVGQLNQQEGYKISGLANNSRVVVVAPKMADSNAFYVRKFNDELSNIRELVKIPGNELLIGWIKWMAIGAMTLGYTGGQGTGKTTLMRAAIEFMPRYWRLRIQEGSAFELWLRKYYPKRNIITFKETAKTSEAIGLVVQKKTDGTVNLVGEAAADETISSVIKTSTVASLCAWFTHHANTARDLVSAARDALINTGAFTDTLLAERYVCSVLRYNLHLVNIAGKRYSERISEYRPVTPQPLRKDFSHIDNLDERSAAFMESQIEAAQRSLDPKLYDVVDIIRYVDGAYVAGERPSERNIRDMMSVMIPRHQKEFMEFVNLHWPEKDQAEKEVA